jgi:hypothetical protein
MIYELAVRLGLICSPSAAFVGTYRCRRCRMDTEERRGAMELAPKDLLTEWTAADTAGMCRVRVVHQPSWQEAAARYDPDVNDGLEVRERLIVELTALVEGTSVPPSLPEPQGEASPVAMPGTLEGAEAAWKALLAPTLEEINNPDPICSSRADYVALIAVRELLFRHHPNLDEARSAGLMCLECWDTWPCDVYQVIEKASRHGG